MYNRAYYLFELPLLNFARLREKGVWWTMSILVSCLCGMGGIEKEELHMETLFDH